MNTGKTGIFGRLKKAIKAQRSSRKRRGVRSLINTGRKRGGRNVRGESILDIAREGGRNIFRRGR